MSSDDAEARTDSSEVNDFSIGEVDFKREFGRISITTVRSSLSRAKHGLKKEKLSHLHFYFHDIVSGRSPTAIRVAEAPTTQNSSTAFGAVVMIDDPLTAGPDLGSKLVGKAQGIYASASQTELGFLMVLNFAFMEGKYNGSYLSVLGRNTVFSAVREMPIVGGSGLFRSARGYARAKTHKVDFNTGECCCGV
ncbi:hypothetical protein ACLB2K_059838 [Fragaria x ananassa]